MPYFSTKDRIKPMPSAHKEGLNEEMRRLVVGMANKGGMRVNSKAANEGYRCKT
jgi:hypothetical protein